MDYQDLREGVCAANRAIGENGLAPLTWGNASAFDRSSGVIGIKPSGVPYARLTPAQIVVLDIDGRPIDDGPKPSSDTATHLHLYRSFPHVGGIVHTHSHAATIWAQACIAIPCLGTTHADHFCGPIPVTRDLTPDEIATDYVGNTGRVIVEAASDPVGVPGVLVARHAPFVWSATIEEALENAIALELIAQMALATLSLNQSQGSIPDALLAFHHARKHGPYKTYGQE